MRRRRPHKDETIHFSFDSFLDLVTNVVGIIIRLILVTWVGARSYHASMQWIDTDPAETPPAAQTKVEPLPPPKITDDPLYSKLEIARHEMDEAKTRLAEQLRELEAAQQKTQQGTADLTGLDRQRLTLESERSVLQVKRTEAGSKAEAVGLSAAELRRRSTKLLEEIKALQSSAGPKKQLKYHAPLSRAVHAEEIFFECNRGKVTYIDMPTFLQEIRQSAEEVRSELKTRWEVERMTEAIGPYRVRYQWERERSALDGPVPSASGFGYALKGWVLEPIRADRGETLAACLAPKSEFRQIVDSLDSNISVVTFWVYPDSFEQFRRLRDYLYERGLDVAGRPLPPGASIAGSRHGTASRGQ
jgi:hypothetical protein